MALWLPACAIFLVKRLEILGWVGQRKQLPGRPRVRHSALQVESVCADEAPSDPPLG